MAKRRRNKAGSFFRLCLSLCLGLPFTGIAQTQSLLLHLRNGDRVSGLLVGEDGSHLTLSNSILGRVLVPLAQIDRRQWLTNALVASTVPATNAPAPSPVPGLSPVVQGQLNALQAAYVTGRLSPDEYHRQRMNLLAAAAAAATNSVPSVAQAGKAAVVPAAAGKPGAPPAKPAGPKQWSGEIFFGTDMAFSEKNRQLYTGRFKLSYTRAPLRNNLDYLFTYGRADGELSANRMDGLMKTDFDLNPRLYLYSLGGAGYDEIRLIDWRYELGPGTGYQVIKQTNFVLRVEGGLHYQTQNFQGNRQEETFYYRLAQDSRWNIGTHFSFDQKIEYLPEFDDFRVYKLRVEANVRYWLRSNMSLNFTVINLYDTVTAEGVRNDDLQLRSSIGVKF